MNVGAAATVAAVVAGVVLGSRLHPSPGWAWMVAAVVLGMFAALFRDPARAVLSVLAVAILAVALSLRAQHGLVSSPIRTLIDHRVVITATATLVSDPEPTRFEARAVLRLDQLVVGDETYGAGGRHVLGVADRSDRSRLVVLSSGDRAEVRGRLRPLLEHEKHWRRRHVVARLSIDDVLGARSPSSSVMRVANELRSLVLRGGEHLPPTDRGLLAGFLVGDTRGIDDSVAAAFRTAGLSHLLVVSGSNVAFVLALASPLLRRLGLHARVAGVMAVLVVFAAVTRFEPSVLRASVMAGVAITGHALGRPTGGLRALALTVSVLLLVDPLLLNSVAFLLSCGASTGILMWARWFTERIPGPRIVAQVAGTTAAAQLGVAPILLPAFGSLPLVALPANLVAVPLSGPITVGGLIAGMVGGVVAPVAPELSIVLHLPVVVLVRVVAAVAGAAAEVPLAVGRGPGMVALSLLVAVGIRRHGSRRLGP